MSASPIKAATLQSKPLDLPLPVDRQIERSAEFEGHIRTAKSPPEAESPPGNTLPTKQGARPTQPNAAEQAPDQTEKISEKKGEDKLKSSKESDSPLIDTGANLTPTGVITPVSPLLALVINPATAEPSDSADSSPVPNKFGIAIGERADFEKLLATAAAKTASGTEMLDAVTLKILNPTELQVELPLTELDKGQTESGDKHGVAAQITGEALSSVAAAQVTPKTNSKPAQSEDLNPPPIQVEFDAPKGNPAESSLGKQSTDSERKDKSTQPTQPTDNRQPPTANPTNPGSSKISQSNEIPQHADHAAVSVREITVQVADRVMELAARRGGSVRILLQPEDLGSISLTVRSFGNQVDADMTATNASVRIALADSRHHLQAAIESKGLSLGSMNVGGQDLSDRQSPTANRQPPPANRQPPAASPLATGLHPAILHRSTDRGVDLRI